MKRRINISYRNISDIILLIYILLQVFSIIICNKCCRRTVRQNAFQQKCSFHFRWLESSGCVCVQFPLCRKLVCWSSVVGFMCIWVVLAIKLRPWFVFLAENIIKYTCLPFGFINIDMILFSKLWHLFGNCVNQILMSVYIKYMSRYKIQSMDALEEYHRRNAMHLAHFMYKDAFWFADGLCHSNKPICWLC